MSVHTQARDELRRQQCIADIRSFDSRGATVQEMQAYADCVDRVHPRELTPEGVMVIKILILITLALSVPVYRFIRIDADTWGWRVFSALGALLIAPLLTGALIVVLGALAFLFSAP